MVLVWYQDLTEIKEICIKYAEHCAIVLRTLHKKPYNATEKQELLKCSKLTKHLGKKCPERATKNVMNVTKPKH